MLQATPDPSQRSLAETAAAGSRYPSTIWPARWRRCCRRRRSGHRGRAGDGGRAPPGPGPGLAAGVGRRYTAAILDRTARLGGGWRFYTRDRFAPVVERFRAGRRAEPAVPRGAGNAGRGRLPAAGHHGPGSPGSAGSTSTVSSGTLDVPGTDRGRRHGPGHRWPAVPDHRPVGEALDLSDLSESKGREL